MKGQLHQARKEHTLHKERSSRVSEAQGGYSKNKD
jgi:hypothetical protein